MNDTLTYFEDRTNRRFRGFFGFFVGFSLGFSKNIYRLTEVEADFLEVPKYRTSRGVWMSRVVLFFFFGGGVGGCDKLGRKTAKDGFGFLFFFCPFVSFWFDNG